MIFCRVCKTETERNSGGKCKRLWRGLSTRRAIAAIQPRGVQPTQKQRELPALLGTQKIQIDCVRPTPNGAAPMKIGISSYCGSAAIIKKAPSIRLTSCNNGGFYYE